MRMELVDYGEWHFEQMLDDVAHCHVIGKADAVGDALEAPIASNRRHTDCERATQANASASCREYKRDFLLRIFRRFLRF